MSSRGAWGPKFGWNHRWLCTSWGKTSLAGRPAPGEINHDFHDLQNENPGVITAWTHWRFLLCTSRMSALVTFPSPHLLPTSKCFPASHAKFMSIFMSLNFNHEASCLSFLTCPAHLGLASVSRQVSSQLRHRHRRKCHIAPCARVCHQSSPAPTSPPLLHPATGFVWSLSRRMIYQASNLRWQSTDMAWTSTPSRLRHGPSSSNADPIIRPMVVCLHRALRLTRRPFYPPPVEGSHHNRGDMIQVFRLLRDVWRTAVILESPSHPGGTAYVTIPHKSCPQSQSD